MSVKASLLRLFVVSLLRATGAQASCPVELDPPSVVVRYGDSVSINCSTNATQLEGIGWESSQGGIGLKRNVQHLTWTVDRVTMWTKPDCYINWSDPRTQCSSTLDLTVYTFPDNISLSGPGGDLYEGRTYNLKCNIPHVAPVGKLAVSWYKGDDLLKTDTFNDTEVEPVNHTSVLPYTANRRDDGVAFRCEAHLDLRPNGPHLNASSQESRFTVLFGPEGDCIGTFVNGVVLLEGETLEKRCPAAGNPLPVIKWLKDGRPFDSSTPMNRSDAGRYQYDADGANSFSGFFRILVLYPPHLVCPATYTALEHTPHNLTCSVDGYPKPDVSWTRDGEDVWLPVNLTRSDTGQYTMRASNTVSSVNATVEINVIYPPSQIVELEDSEVAAGSSVWLKCSSTGNPRPQYSWTYYQTANVMEENEDGVSRLHIQNATAYNEGSYTCHAWNHIGNVSETVSVTVKGARPECPVKITPHRMVVQYQDRAQRSARCEKMLSDARHIKNIFWKLPQGKIDNLSWIPDTENDWDLSPACTATVNVLETCQKDLDFTLYKTPDSVSIRPVDTWSSAVEDRDFQLRCDVTNVAPAGKLEVRWYRGNESIHPLTVSKQVTCYPDIHTDCNWSVRSPVNASFTVSFTAKRSHSGQELRCEALLDLGAEGPQPPPNTGSARLNVTVSYKPSINATKLPRRIPVFRGYPEELVCEADGHPPPEIRWLYNSDKTPHVSNGTIIVSEEGVYNCSATNDVDSTSYAVEVILKEDYLPLIAGFVAVAVVSISIVFLFIYSIYYKNTRMRRYSLKNVKLDPHSGNVAHNGWDMQFPMTKLS